MAKIQSSDDLTKFIPIPAGVHTLTLTKVEERDTPNIFADKAEDGTYIETGTEIPPNRAQLLWVFESDDLRPDGEPYAYAYWTGRYYGDDRAKLTAFLNAILPDSTTDERKSIDTDSLISARFRVRITSTKNKAGKDRPLHTLIEPAIAVTVPSPVAGRMEKKIAPVNASSKAAIGTSLQAASVAEGADKLKARLLTELGRLGYTSYADFTERGDRDATKLLKFINPTAFDDDKMPF